MCLRVVLLKNEEAGIFTHQLLSVTGWLQLLSGGSGGCEGQEGEVVETEHPSMDTLDLLQEQNRLHGQLETVCKQRTANLEVEQCALKWERALIWQGTDRVHYNTRQLLITAKSVKGYRVAKWKAYG